MSDSRAQHIATAIGLGAVLVAGGYSNDGQTVTTLASGQSYNGAFTPLLTDMIEPRAQTTIASLSGSGLFILSGGAKFVLANCGNNCVTVVPQSLSTTEGFSSFDLDFFPEPSMNTARRGHTATLLADGSTILIVGGANSTLGVRNTPSTASTFLPKRGESVTYVSGTICYLCLGSLILSIRELRFLQCPETSHRLASSRFSKGSTTRTTLDCAERFAH